MRKKSKLNKDEITFIIFIIIRTIVFLLIVLSFIRKSYIISILCIISSLMFLIPATVENNLRLESPSIFEIIIYIILLSILVLDELNKFNIKIRLDTIEHTISGFLYAFISFFYMHRIIKKRNNIKIPLTFIIIISICFSMTISVCWEIYEYSADKIFKRDMQKDVLVTSFSTVTLDNNKIKPIQVNDIKSTIINTRNETITIEGGYLDIGLNDTMKDLMVSLIGAITFNMLILLYILNRDKYHIVKHLIPTKIKNIIYFYLKHNNIV